MATQANTNTITDATASAPASPLFSRNATGLVKLGTPYKLMVANIVNIGITYAAFYYWLGPANFPRTSMLAAFLVTLPFGLGFLLTYALFSIAMPRSGGEYLWVSRAIHPSVGFGVSMVGVIANAFYVGIGGYWVATLVLGPVFAILGVTQDSTTLAHWGSSLQQTGFPSWPWAFGIVGCIGTGVILVAGMRVYYKFQQIAWTVGLVTLGLGVVVMLVSSHHHFVTAFNQFSAGSGGPHNAYAVVNAAGRAKPTGFSAFSLFGFFSLISYTAVVSSYLGGEVRTPRRSQLIASVGGGAVYFVILLILMLGIAAQPGLHFNNEAAWLSVNAPKGWPVASSPTFMLWMSLLSSSNVFLLVCVALALVLFSLNWLPTATIMPSRALFAWGFDRLLPSQASAVSKRTGGPTVAVIVLVTVSAILVSLYSDGVFKYVAPYLGLTAMYLVVCALGIVFPFLPRSRHIFAASSANIRVLGIPLLSIAGVVGTVFYCIAIYYELKVTGLGFNTTSNILLTGLSFVIPFLLYFPIRWARSRQGIDLASAARELPPD